MVLVGQLDLIGAHTASTATVMLNKTFFRSSFSSFESGGITKPLMTGPSGNSEFCFPWTLNVPLRSRGNKTHSFPWGHSLSTYCQIFVVTIENTDTDLKSARANTRSNVQIS